MSFFRLLLILLKCEPLPSELSQKISFQIVFHKSYKDDLFQVYNVIVNVQFALVELRVCASGTQELPQNLLLGGSAVFPQLSLSGADIIANIALKLGFHFHIRLWFLRMSYLVHQKSSFCG